MDRCHKYHVIEDSVKTMTMNEENIYFIHGVLEDQARQFNVSVQYTY